MRSLDQNAILHVWIREITEHLSHSGVKHISANTIKQVVLHTLGNKTEVFGVYFSLTFTGQIAVTEPPLNRARNKLLMWLLALCLVLNVLMLVNKFS